MILITGATGIVGAHIALYLAQKNESFKVCRRKESKTSTIEALFTQHHMQHVYQKLDWLVVDLTDITTMENIFQGIKTIYHCAGLVSFYDSDAKDLYLINVKGTRNVLNYAIDAGVKNFLHLSSIAVLDAVNEEIITEKSEYLIKKYHSAYAHSKYESEMEVWRAAEEGLNVCVINPSVIWCSGFWNQSSGKLLKNLLKGYIFDARIPLIAVEDVAQCAVQLVENKKFGERFIIHSESLSYTEIAQQIKQIYPIKTKFIPKIYLKLGLKFLWLINYFKRKKLAPATINALLEKTDYSNSKIMNTLSYNFISIKNIIPTTVNAYLNYEERI